MNYHVAVCDDSTADRQYILNMLTEWAAEAGHSVLVAEFSSAEQFLFEYEDKSDYDILLLDIEMGDMDGVTMAKKLRRVNETVQIIFVTGYSDYISEGYEVAALHYLMKPVKQEKLFEVLNRAVEKVQKNEKLLLLENGGELFRIPLYQIRYIDVQHNYVTVHAKEEVTVKKTLGDIENSLDDRFCRVGRSAIVNLSCISRVAKTDIVLQDGTLIPLPRGAYEKVNRAIIGMK